MMNFNMPKMVRVSEKDTFNFKCSRCGQCCELPSPLMVDPLDVFRMSKFLYGDQTRSMLKVIDNYLSPFCLQPGFPVMVMMTKGERRTCIFHSVLGCGIYSARPRVCRLYPLIVTPGEETSKLECSIALENMHHYDECSSVQVGQWLQRNLTDEDREYMKLEADYVLDIAHYCMRDGLHCYELETIESMVVFYRYVSPYDMTRPFLPQYKEHHRELMESLHLMFGEVQGK